MKHHARMLSIHWNSFVAQKQAYPSSMAVVLEEEELDLAVQFLRLNKLDEMWSLDL
jgi:hypothetical protein